MMYPITLNLPLFSENLNANMHEIRYPVDLVRELSSKNDITFEEVFETGYRFLIDFKNREEIKDLNYLLKTLGIIESNLLFISKENPLTRQFIVTDTNVKRFVEEKILKMAIVSSSSVTVEEFLVSYYAKYTLKNENDFHKYMGLMSELSSNL